MDPTTPWYKSAIIRQQIVAFIIAALGLLKLKVDFDIDATVAAIFAGIAAIIPVWTIVTRLFKPSPNLTATAVRKEAELVSSGKLNEAQATGGGVQVSKASGGFAQPLMLALLLAVSVLSVAALSGCESLGLAAPSSYDQRVAYARGELTGLVDATTAGIQKGSVSKQDGVAVLALAKNARDVIDSADLAFGAGDVSTAEGRLSLALGVLQQIQTYVDRSKK